MSNFYQHNPREYLSDNIQNANYVREKKEYLRKQELESDKRAMATLAQQLEEEKQMEKNRKRQIQNAQFQEYSNYMKNKYQNHNPNLNNRDNNLQIKIGGENRYLTRKNYNQENENLCINPTSIQLKSNNQTINYSEQGRINQRGQSHGYNIISNEPFQNNTNVENKNVQIPKEENPNNYMDNSSPQYLNNSNLMNNNNLNYQMELNNINQGNINQNVPQSNYPNQLYQNNSLNMYPQDYNVQNNKYKKIDELNNNNMLPSQQTIPNNNLPKEDDKPSEEDYRRYNEYLELLKRQEEEELKAYYKAQSMQNEMNYLPNQNPNPQVNSLNNINEMNKPLDLYDEYLRRGENINLPMSKLPNNNLPMSNLPNNNSAMTNLPNNNLQITNMPNNNLQDNNLQMRNLQDNNLMSNIPNNNLTNLQDNNLPISNIPNNNLTNLQDNTNYYSQNNNYLPQMQDPNKNYLLQQNEMISNQRMEDSNALLNRQMNNMSLDARNEYLANKKKNNSSFNNILSDEPVIPPQDKYNSYSPFTMSNYDKTQKQKQYKEYLDSQMNAKKLYKDTYYNLEKGQPNQNRINERNPYLEMKEKNSKFTEIPQNPYSQKNYNFGGNSSLSNNPIVNSSYNDNRRISSGRLQSLGNNIVNP